MPGTQFVKALEQEMAETFGSLILFYLLSTKDATLDNVYAAWREGQRRVAGDSDAHKVWLAVGHLLDLIQSMRLPTTTMLDADGHADIIRFLDSDDVPAEAKKRVLDLYSYSKREDDQLRSFERMQVQVATELHKLGYREN
jgi:hypothetical protein